MNTATAGGGNMLGYAPGAGTYIRNDNTKPLKYAAAATGVLLADDPSGIGFADDVAVPIIWAGAVATTAVLSRIYVTYTLTNEKTGSVYVGRTSGFLPPQLLVTTRYWTHHMRLFGYSNPQMDVAARGPLGYAAIRGREQIGRAHV